MSLLEAQGPMTETGKYVRNEQVEMGVRGTLSEEVEVRGPPVLKSTEV